MAGATDRRDFPRFDPIRHNRQNWWREEMPLDFA
jgi:hypothetical protein